MFSGEKVRPEYPEPTPVISDGRTLQGVRVTSLEDLVRMKLSSFRLKDQMHLKDMDEAGLLTPVMEGRLGPIHRERLRQVRAAS